MPQHLFWVREKESGQAFQMHSVDMAEGLAIGDFEVIRDPQKEVSPEERAAAAAGMRATGAFPHPELQTPEQRAETRRQANEQAALLAGLPPGTPVVVQAPSDRPESRAAHQAAARSTTPAASSTPSRSSESSSGSSSSRSTRES